jgi:hypothetical protein
MDEAWVCYFPDNGKISAIGWEKPTGPSIAIPAEMAIKFMSGETRKSSYRVVDRGDGPVLELIQSNTAISTFWSLTSIDDEDSGVGVQVSRDGIEVMIPEGSGHACLIFATLKNDPSWLIDTWDLRRFRETNGVINIPYPNADQFSIYIRTMHETQDM